MKNEFSVWGRGTFDIFGQLLSVLKNLILLVGSLTSACTTNQSGLSRLIVQSDRQLPQL